MLKSHPIRECTPALALERASRLDDAVASYEAALEVWSGHIWTVQALARLHVRERRDDWLSESALRGENEDWRDSARAERVRTDQ